MGIHLLIYLGKLLPSLEEWHSQKNKSVISALSYPPQLDMRFRCLASYFFHHLLYPNLFQIVISFQGVFRRDYLLLFCSDTVAMLNTRSFRLQVKMLLD
jgi:hypothetical protein